MTYIIVALALCFVSFAAGFFAGVKNASSSKVEKAKSILDALKGK